MANNETVIRTNHKFKAVQTSGKNFPLLDKNTIPDLILNPPAPATDGVLIDGESETFEITIGNPSRLKVMLVWMDEKGDPAAQNALVNDLDLELLFGLNPAIQPYSLSASSPSNAATNTGKNSVDNVEQIIVDNPAAGTYTIRVSAASVPTGSQEFAIVICKDAAMEATISAQPTAPGANRNGLTYLPVTGGEVTFTANVIGGTPPYSIAWDFDGDGSNDRIDSGVTTLPFTTAPAFTYPGGSRIYQAKLTVTDSSPTPALTATSELTVAILSPPTAGITAVPTSGEAPLEVFLSGSLSTSNLSTFHWDFGDNTGTITTTTPNTSHTYTGGGSFTPTLFVTDFVGQTSNSVSTSILTTKRSVDTFAHKLRANLNFTSNTAKLQLITIVSELALTRKEARDQIKNEELVGDIYTVRLDPDGSNISLGDFSLDKRGSAKTADGVFKLISSRKGQIKLKSTNPNIITAFQSLGMSATTPSSNKKDPATYFTVPAVIEREDVVYRTVFNVLWTNKNGSKAKAKQ